MQVWDRLPRAEAAESVGVNLVSAQPELSKDERYLRAERPQNLLHQFYENHRFNVDDFSEGIRLIAWGYFQKMIIADRAAIYVNAVYGQWQAASGLMLIVATLGAVVNLAVLAWIRHLRK